MRKTFLLLLVTITLCFPPVSIYLALTSARHLQNYEADSMLEFKLKNELNNLEKSFADKEKLLRDFTRIREAIATQETTSVAQNLDKTNNRFNKTIIAEQIKDLKNEISQVLQRYPFPIEVSIVVQDANQTERIKQIRIGPDLGLNELTKHIKEMKKPASLTMASPQPELEKSNAASVVNDEFVITRNNVKDIQHILINSLTIVYSNASQIIIKEKESIILLSHEKLGVNLAIFFIAELKDLSRRGNSMDKIKNYISADIGAGLFFANIPKPVFSKYFDNQPHLKKIIQRRLKLLDDNPAHISEAGYEIFISGNDLRRQNRYFVMAKPSRSGSKGTHSQNLLLATLCFISCLTWKIIVEKMVMGRGPDLTIKVLLPLMFLFLIIQPVFAAAFLVGDFFHSSFANLKAGAAEKLAKDIQDIDLVTLDKFRETLNFARSINSVEKMSQIAKIPYQTNELELGLHLLTNFEKIESETRFTSLWLKFDQRPFVAIRLSVLREAFEKAEVDNPLTQLFAKRFQEIIRHYQGQDSSAVINKQDKFDQELKGEFSRDFFLKIMGSEEFFRFRQNNEMLMRLNATFRRETVFAGPISYRNKPFGYGAWHIGVHTSKSYFPTNRLSEDSQSPRLAFTGNERIVYSLRSNLSALQSKFSDLCRISFLAHVSRSMINSQIEEEEKTTISVAMPANHSDYTLAGSEVLKSYKLFRQELIALSLKYLIALISMGMLLAFAGAVYFTAPLKELTDATKQIGNGYFSVRISQNHPDEFAFTGEAFNLMAKGLEEGQRLKNFVSDSVLREVEGSGGAELVDSAQSKNATIIFSAICGFAEYQKNNPADQVFALLQKHLNAAAEATTAWGGEIDKMIEDKIMIVFEHDNENQQYADIAIQAADLIRHSFTSATEFKLGIGINTGLTVAGVMGAAEARLSRTVVGDPVNLAARLASLAVKQSEGGIIVSGQMKELMTTGFSATKLPVSSVKGKTQSVQAYLLTKEG